MTRQLIALSYSPWSEKARWALDHHGLEYREIEHVPLIGELGLRIRARKVRGRTSVPLYISEQGERVPDSWEIARKVDAEVGGGERSLFPAEHAPGISRWHQLSERALAAGRAIVSARIAQDREAQLEALPPLIPAALHGLARPLAGLGVGFLRRKYGYAEHSLQLCEQTMEGVLAQLAAGLEAAGGPDQPLCGRFTFAEITMATALQMVQPVDDRYISLGPATRRCWTVGRLAQQYEGMLRWRDAIYERHRG